MIRRTPRPTRPANDRTVTGAGLLLDETALARAARTALAAAEDGVLLVASGPGGPYRESTVVVADDDGEALLSIGPRSPVADAAERRCHAALMLAPQDEHTIGLTLVGRLAVHTRHDDGAEWRCSTATLSVDRVLASCPRAGRPSPTDPRYEIPLAAYALAEPDAFTLSARRIVAHLNRDHPHHVRVLAAHSAHRPLSSVIGASVTHLSARSLGLWWVGADGAQSETITFAQPVSDVRGLGEEIRARLGVH